MWCVLCCVLLRWFVGVGVCCVGVFALACCCCRGDRVLFVRFDLVCCVVLVVVFVN